VEYISRISGLLKKLVDEFLLCLVVFPLVFWIGWWANERLNPLNVLVNENYRDDENALDRVNVRAMIRWLRKDQSHRLGLVVITQDGLYVAPNIDHKHEIMIAVRRKSDGVLLLNMGFEEGKRMVVLK